jgi:hypothetical protein
MCRDSEIIITGLEDRGLIPDRGKSILFLIISMQKLGDIQPLIRWVPGVKQQGREADHYV